MTHFYNKYKVKKSFLNVSFNIDCAELILDVY